MISNDCRCPGCGECDAHMAARVSSTKHLSKLDAILFDRPAGRNIIGHAIDTIEKLRAELAATHSRRIKP